MPAGERWRVMTRPTSPASQRSDAPLARRCHRWRCSMCATPKVSSSSITRRSAGTAIRSSRQARRPVNAPAAGIDAASMARRCQDLSQKTARGICPPAKPPPAKGGGGLFLARSRKEWPEGPGGTRARKSPPPSTLRPSRQANAASCLGHHRQTAPACSADIKHPKIKPSNEQPDSH